MTEQQLQEAVGRMIESTHQMMDDYRKADGEYRTVSARGVLRDLGFDGNDLQQVLEFIAAGGFDYCLDPAIPMTGHHDARGQRPARDVCYWGADQLESRLRSLNNVPFHVRNT